MMRQAIMNLNDYKEGIVGKMKNHGANMKIIKKYLAILGAILVITIPMTSSLVSQTDARQKEQLMRDIDVMENVLDDLIIIESPMQFNFGDHVRGIYLDGFGLLFDAESYDMYNLSKYIQKTIKKIPKIDVTTDKEKKIVIDVNVDNESKSNDDEKTPEQIIEETKKLLTQFFINYASSVKSLGPNDRICVNIRIGNKGRISSGEKDAEMLSQLRATALVSDLTKFRQDKIDEMAIISKIQFTESTGGNEADREIEVMSKIFDSAMGKSGNEKFYTLTGGTNGLYLDNYGVLFFSPAKMLNMNMNIIVEKGLARAEKAMRKIDQRMREFDEQMREYDERMRKYDELKRKLEKRSSNNQMDSEESILPPAPPVPPVPPVSSDEDSETMDINVQFDVQSKQTQAQRDSVLNKLKNDIIEVVGQYGHTLRKIKDSECIMVAVDLNDRLSDDEAKRMYFKFKKSDVTRYNREEITFDTFKETVKVWNK